MSLNYIEKYGMCSFVDPVNSDICFYLKGRKPVGFVTARNKDLKAIYNFQLGAMKLFRQAWGVKAVPRDWRRTTRWTAGYDYQIESGIAYVYRECPMVAQFKIFCDDSLVLEFFFEKNV